MAGGTDSRHKGSGDSKNPCLCSRSRSQKASPSASASPPIRLRAALGAGQPHVQLPAVECGGGDRQRAASPAVHGVDRLRRRALLAQRDLDRRSRQHLDRHLEQHPERAHCADHQPGDVVAGDVLHHLAAEAQHLAAAVEEPDAEHVVAHRAAVRAPRP
jgi:hypothetical protein